MECSNDDGVAEIVKGWAAVRPELDVSGLNVFGRLHRSYLLYRAHVNEGFEQHGTNEAGFDVLACLRRAEPTYQRTAGELAKQTLVTTGGLTLRVDRLAEAGLVERHRDVTDSRVVHVTLTAAGKELIDRASDTHFATLNRMLESLGPQQREDLAMLLADLEGALRAHDAPGVHDAVVEASRAG